MKHSVEGYRLLLEGAVALSRVEANGLLIDTVAMDRSCAEVDVLIREAQDLMRKDEVWTEWRKRFGAKANLGSRDQLATVLFDCLGFEGTSFTPTGRPQADDAALARVKTPFVKAYRANEKLKKLRGTYLEGIRREVCNGVLHPSYNLHNMLTYRSSSDSPNFQNVPVRDPFIAKYIRSCFVARTGNRLVEVDYSGAEVRVAACYHKDPNMLRYLEDDTTDMHRDTAADLYMLGDGAGVDKDSLKKCRYGAKNMYVFPVFYGSYYLDCARNLWNWIDKGELTGPGGVPMKAHLAAKGVKRLGACSRDARPVPGTFEHHVQKVETHFWGKRFPVYAAWKKEWYARYLGKGYFDTLTGFRIGGLMKRNEALNYPIQGSAFHCLLWSLIRVQKRLRKYKMGAKVVGQIHDSLILDVPEKEVDAVLQIAKSIMSTELRAAWPWVIVRMDVEADATPVGGNWYEKAPIAIPN